MTRRHVALLVVGACGRVDFDPAACPGFTLDDVEVNPSSRAALSAHGGAEPIAYTLTGPGALDATTFVAPPEQATSLVTARDAAGCTATATITTLGRTLFYLAGAVNNVPGREVWRGSDPLTWTRIADFPAVRASAAVAVFHDAIWYVGGSTDLSVNGHSEVWSSRDGLTWTAAPLFPVAVTDAIAIGWHDQLWVLGGHGNPGGVWSTSDGATWTKHAGLPIPSHGGQAAVIGDRLVYLGGHDDTLYFDTEYATGDGETWTNLGVLPSKREFQATAIHAGTIVFGGGTDATKYLDDSFHSTDGVTWTAGGALPGERMYGQLRFISDRFYSVGGTDGLDIFSTTDGTAWRRETSTLPPRFGGALVELTPR